MYICFHLEKHYLTISEAMNTSEKFCLKWNDFQGNVISAFRNLREDTHFSDVTLACEDGQDIETHQVVLAASSPFFQRLLSRNKHPHPLIYMRGITSVNLLAIIDFLYYGEANIYQENLDTFLNIAEELNLKGLDGGGGNGEEIIHESKEQDLSTKKSFKNMKPTTARDKNPKNETKISLNSSNYPDVNSFERAVVIQKDTFSGDLEELDVKIKAMIGRGENMIPKGSALIKVYVCQVCGKEGASTTVIKDQIKVNHIEGISIPCNSCQKVFRSKKMLMRHMCKTLPASYIGTINKPKSSLN